MRHPERRHGRSDFSHACFAKAFVFFGGVSLRDDDLAELAAGMRRGAGLCVLTSNRFLTTRGGAASRGA